MEKKCDILLPPSPPLPPQSAFPFSKDSLVLQSQNLEMGGPCWLMKLKQMENQGVHTLSSGFFRFSAKFGTCTVVSVGPLLKLKCAHSPLNLRNFIFIKCTIYTLDGASAKISTNSHETDYSVWTGSFLGWFIGLVVPVQYCIFFVLLWLLYNAQDKILFSSPCTVFLFISPIVQLPGRAVVLGHLSLSMCLCIAGLWKLEINRSG